MSRALRVALFVTAATVAPVPPARADTARMVCLVVDLEGGILGPVELPEGFRPTDIGEDYVLGIIRDDLDVEQVRMYPLHRDR